MALFWLTNRLVRPFRCGNAGYGCLCNVIGNHRTLGLAMIDRRVRLVEPKLPDGDTDAGAPPDARDRLSDYEDRPNLVLLGDPGAGKTWSFKELSRQSSGHYLTCRSFLNLPLAALPDVLFIDGLDEQRAGPADNAIVDQIVRKLFQRAPRVVRISCRSRDWLGETDLVAFRDYFDHNGGFAVVALEAITEKQQIEILCANGQSDAAARELITEAKIRDLESFLQNPQKLLMLARVVSAGEWPATAYDLFDRATRLELREENTSHVRKDGGRFTAEELQLTAGAVCAARLIADIEGVSLAAKDQTAAFPSYRALDFLDLDKVEAALKRPLFKATATPECVDYDHRTSAEFLAALWLAEQIRQGLPIGRVRALLGTDGYPSSELRGLHAWMPLMLPEYAEIFIFADPLGVLEYGDAASLPPRARLALLNAIAAIANENPWFLSFDRNSAKLASLVQDDSVDQLCAILKNPDAPRDLRRLALEAFDAAKPCDAAFETLGKVLKNENLDKRDRAIALHALCAFGENGERFVVREASRFAGDEESVLYLRTEALDHCYGKGFGPADIVALVRDYIASRHDGAVGVLWSLCDRLPIADVPDIIDNIVSLVPERFAADVSAAFWDASSFIGNMIDRVAKETPSVISAERIVRWMQLRARLERFSLGRNEGAFIDFLQGAPQQSKSAFYLLIEQPEFIEPKGRRFQLFSEIIAPIASADTIGGWCIERLSTESDARRKAFVFHTGLQYCLPDTAAGKENFATLYTIGENDPELKNIMDAFLVCDLDDWQFERRDKRAALRKEQYENREKLRADFADKRETIRSGQAIGNLAYAAQIYLNQFTDVDRDAEPAARLASFLGDENAAAALEGFAVMCSSGVPPTVDEILAKHREGKYLLFWQVFVAAVDAQLRKGVSLAGVSSDVAAAILAFDVLNLTSERLRRNGAVNPSFRESVRQAFPEIGAGVYRQLVEYDLERGKESNTALYEYLDDTSFRKWRHEALLPIIDKYSDMKATTLRQLLRAALCEPALHDALANRAFAAIDNDAMDADKLGLWRATAYLLRPEKMRVLVKSAIEKDRNAFWALRNFLGLHERTPYDQWPLHIDDMRFLIASVGSQWPPVGHPSGGWSGDTNPWDAFECVRGLINRLSAETDVDATQALKSLIADEALSKYRDYLKNALALHQIARREVEYDRPDWPRTVAALSNQAPANAADLHALVLDHLHDVAKEIDGNNVDIYKQFWNEKSRGQIDVPKSEDSCRDVFVNLLRSRLAPFGLSVEPEGHMSANKRVDIAVSRPGLKTVIEVKLSHSDDLWTAMSTQLNRLYTRDPETKGFGVLLVFWHGAASGKKLTADPSTGAKANSASELENQLNEQNSKEISPRLRAVVVNVSGAR